MHDYIKTITIYRSKNEKEKAVFSKNSDVKNSKASVQKRAAQPLETNYLKNVCVLQNTYARLNGRISFTPDSESKEVQISVIQNAIDSPSELGHFKFITLRDKNNTAFYSKTNVTTTKDNGNTVSFVCSSYRGPRVPYNCV